MNVHTAPPLTSLAVLLPTAEQRSALKIETVAAEILATFERMWAEFLDERGSFAPFNDLYLERWLHSYVSCPQLATCMGAGRRS